MGRCFEQGSHHKRFACAVVPDRARRTDPRRPVHIGQDAARLLLQLDVQQLSAVGAGVGVGLVPFHSGCHLQDVANAHAIVGAIP